MTLELPQLPPGWECVERLLDALRACQEDTERFFSGLFDDLEAIAIRLEAKADAEVASVAAAHDSRQLEFVVDSVQRILKQLEPDNSDAPDAAQTSEADTAQIDQERKLLETELDSLRHRAADLSELLDGQRASAQQQQEKWSAEFHRLHDLLAQMVAPLQDLVARSGDQPPTLAIAGAETMETQAPGVRQSPSAESADSVVDSVAAQFEFLQKDMVRRRGR